MIPFLNKKYSLDNAKSVVLTKEEAEAILNQNKEQAEKDLEDILYTKPHQKRRTHHRKTSLRQKLRRILRRR